MAVPSSGELFLRADIALEVDGSASGSDVSLGTLADSAGFDTPPDTMQEFYGYVSYIQPTISGTPSTHDVYDTNMDVVSPTFSNSSAGTVERGFYIGTSTTATSNTFYSAGNTSSTSGTFEYGISGLSGSTTYRIFAVIRDTQSPARFTEAVSSMKSQATQAAVSYTTTWGGNQNLHGSKIAGNAGVTATYMSASCGSSYNHVYYGWSNPGGGNSQTKYLSGTGGVWEYFSYNPNISRYWGFRSDGVTTQNRTNQYCKIYSSASGNGGEAKVTHGWYSIPGNGSNTLTGLTFTNAPGNGWVTESWQAVGSYGGGYTQVDQNAAGSWETQCYGYNFI